MTNTKRNLKRIVAVGALALASLIPNRVDAETARYVATKDQGTMYVEATTEYKLPLRIKGFTILDLNWQGQGYFGKTYVSRDLRHGFDLSTQVISDNEVYTKAGLGLTYAQVPRDGTFVKLGVYPVFTSEDARLEVIVGQKLPKGFGANGYFDWDFSRAGNGKFHYGEASIGRNLGKAKINYNPVLKGKETGNELEHRVSIGCDF